MIYCPKCGMFDLHKNKYPYGCGPTFLNVRDGWGTPICHFKCQCGNDYAGLMYIDEDLENAKSDCAEDVVEYYKDIIRGYNPGGRYTDEYKEDE